MHRPGGRFQCVTGTNGGGSWSCVLVMPSVCGIGCKAGSKTLIIAGLLESRRPASAMRRSYCSGACSSHCGDLSSKYAVRPQKSSELVFERNDVAAAPQGVQV